MSDKTPRNEEIELGQFLAFLKQLFGSGAQGLKNSAFGFLKILMFLIISLKRNWKILGLFGIAGIIAAFSVLFFGGRTYYSSMVIRPNFGSSEMIYDQVNYYNDLIKQKDTATLNNIFNPDLVKHLQKIEVQPIVSQKEKQKIYNDYLAKVDTALTKSYFSYDEYIDRLDDWGYYKHEIIVSADSSINFTEFEGPILAPLMKSEYLISQYEIRNRIAVDQIGVLEEIFENLDSLTKIKRSSYLLPQGPANGETTKVYLSEEDDKKNDEEWIYERMMSTRNTLSEVSYELVENNKIVKIITRFKSRGVKESRVLPFLELFFGMLGLGAFIILLRGFWRFTSRFEKEHFSS
jgi:hypothetical protein